MAKKRLKFSNRLSYTIIAIIALALVAVGVYASVGAGTTPDPGHNIQSIGAPSGCLVGQYLQYVNDQRCISGPCWICANVSSVSSDNWAPSDLKATTSNAPNGNFSGYKGMNDWIQTHGCSGYHVCSTGDAIDFLVSGGMLPSTGGWVNNDGVGYTEQVTVNDAGLQQLWQIFNCNGWTTSQDDTGGQNYDGIEIYNKGYVFGYSGTTIAPCNSGSHPVLCCK
jgi:hypothetical protein